MLFRSGAGQDELLASVRAHTKALTARIGRPPDRAILGCTHYEIIADLFRAALPAGTPLIQQPASTADALELYLERHPDSTAALLRFGICAQRADRIELARTYLKRVIALAPDSTDAAEARKFLVMWE